MSWLGKFDDFDQFQTTSKPTNNRAFSSRAPNFDSSTSSTEHTPTQDLIPGMPNVSIVGLVISKEEAREITSKSSNSSSSPRFVLNLVLRDSVSSYISATCWGTDAYIKDLAKSFHVYDVVEIYNPQIQTKPSDGADKFRPWTPSPFHLNLSEHHSTVKGYDAWDSSNYTSLQHVPIRPSNDFYSLNDVVVNGQAISGEHINLHAAVKSVGAVKEMVTKKGRNAKRCEVKLFDETSASFALILWDEETINQAVLWNPGEYVIFASDVRVYYDDFRSCMVATADSKTVFIVNPDTKEAHALYMFAQTQNLRQEAPEPDSFGQKDPEMSEVEDIVSVRGAKEAEAQVSTGSPYFCILYAHITQFNIDQDTGTPIRYKCPKCKQSLDDNQQVCLNPPCIDSSTSGQFVADIQYDMPITLSDHTGSITNCRLNSSAAEEMIGIQAPDFVMASGDHKTQTKWKFLLERCKVFLKIQRGRNGKTFCRVLSCTIPEPFEVQRHFEQFQFSC